MYRKLLILLVVMAATGVFAQSSDTLYIYETVIEYDTLITRDTTYIHDTIHLTYPQPESISTKHLREKKSDRKHHEESPILEELFQGFHLGYIGQFDLMMPAQLTEDSRLMSVPRAGGHAGLEFSYHFARWFGVSAALNYGTTGALRLKFYWQESNPETIKRNYLYGTGLSMPVKFEFHYPISPKAWAVVDAGVRIRMPWNTFIHGYDRDHSELGENNSSDYSEQLSEDNPLILNYNYIDRDILNLDILAGVGMYFRLPNNDLLRWNVGLNAALRQFAIGSYVHRIYNATNSTMLPQEDEYQDILGDFSLRNHFFYAQIAYIHTFKNAKQKQETAPYALKYGNNKMYNHEFKLEVSDWFGVLFMQTHWLHLPTGSEVSYDSPEKISPVISGSYYYRVTPWFWVGLSMNYAHYTKNIKVRYAWDDPSAMRVEGTRSYHLLGIMPDIRFSYFNRPHVTLYSSLSIGVNLHIPGKYEGDETYKDYYPDPLFYSAFQATLFGVKAGGSHWFGSFELGAGYKGIASLGVGYEF
ncbi:MAG: hypothetical protein J6X51_02785 [Bacteroidales bacterium]|nr:hypothetical protein [Bacteroidales bacterium]